MKYIVPIAILAATAFDHLCMLLRRFDQDYDEGCEVPRGWIAWGTCKSSLGARGHNYRYFLLRLPSWQWMPNHCSDNRWDWGQLTLFRFAGRWSADFWIRS